MTEHNASVHTARGGVIVRVFSAATVEEAVQAVKQHKQGGAIS